MEFIDLKRQYRELKPAVDARIQAVLDHGQFIMGPEVQELETSLAAYVGTPHCITVASGTEALLISLMALGLKPGDEVITSPFTFVATAEVLVLLGLVPVFVDVEPDTALIDAAQLEAAITPRTRAILPVSLYGQLADMDAISNLASRYSLVVIEDGAQSFGALYKGRRSCSMGTFGCTSFFPSKPLGCYGDGGAIFCDDPALAQACREIRVHGQSRRYHHTRIGVGGRMDTLQCAVVLAKMERFPSEVEARFLLGDCYREALAGISGVEMIAVREERRSVWGQMTVRVKDRAAVLERFRKAGVPTAVHYPTPLHRQPAYLSWAPVDGLASAERLAEEVLSLPMHPYLSSDEIGQVAELLRG